jgi:CRP/FNR family nitrogen fixation transcriptional regulator
MQTVYAPPSGSIAPFAPLTRNVPLARPEPRTSALGATRAIAKDGEIFAEGDRASFVYKVVSGAVRTCKLLNDGRRQVAAFHLPGDFFGIEAGEEHRFTAEALGDTAVIAYRRGSLDTLPTGGEPLSQQILLAAAMRELDRARAHTLLLGRKSAVEKIAAFLLDLAERVDESEHIDLPMCRTDIADYLGLTIETVSRTLTHLERQGIIAIPAHRRSIVLRNMSALQLLDA